MKMITTIETYISFAGDLFSLSNFIGDIENIASQNPCGLDLEILCDILTSYAELF